MHTSSALRDTHDDDSNREVWAAIAADLVAEVRRMRAENASLQDLQLAAGCDAPVLITADSTCTAERIALWIHRQSERRDAPFLVVDAALRELQSALFDALRSVLTTNDAADTLVTTARGGTLFMPHIEEMSPAMQVTLLRFMELPEMRSRVRLRLIAATDQRAYERVHAGYFREDLFYRLNVIHIAMPPADLYGSQRIASPHR
jgi:two-component system, NtrC family, response regulator AtoC